MKRIFFYFLCVNLLLGFFSSKAQEPFSFHLNNLNKLPVNAIYDIVQDKKGFIWMSGNDGLFRYDGFGYHSFKSTGQSSVSGSNIEMDNYGRVWYENFDGFLYYVENDTLKNLRQNTPVGFLPFGITAKHLFVAQKNGIDVFDIKDLSFIKTINIDILNAEHAVVKGADFYFIANHIIYKITDDLVISSTDFFKKKDFKVKLIHTYKDRLYVLSKNNEEKELYFFDTNLNYLNSIYVPHVSYVQGTAAIDDYIWIMSSAGAYVYDETGSLQYSKKGILPQNSISAAMKDYQNNYWISTTNNGVYIIQDMKSRIYSLNGYLPLRIEKRKNGYLLGTQRGELLRLDSTVTNIELMAADKDKLPVYYISADNLGGSSVYSSKGFSYVPQDNFSIEKQYNIALKEVVKLDDKYFAYAASGFCGLLLNTVAKPGLSSAWDSLYNKNIYNYFPHTARLVWKVRGKSAAYNTAQQKIVFATNIGLYIVTPRDSYELLCNNESFYADGVMWHGDDIYALNTRGDLYQISQEGTFKPLNRELGILDADIKKIKKYEDRMIIIGAKTVYIYDPAKKIATPMQLNIDAGSIKDVLLEKEQLIILINEGVLKVNIADRSVKTDVRFYINSIFVNQKKRTREDIHRLSYEENNIDIYFSLLAFSGAPPRVYYRINKGAWVAVNKDSRNVQFPSLSSGEYTIEFKSGERLLNDVIIFEITAPFWKMWWFYLICTGVLGAGILLYFKRQSLLMQGQIKLLNEKVTLEKSLSKSMLTSIKSQMNPHFFYNALNTIQAYIFTNDKQKANTYLAKFSKLTRIILEMSERETISIREEVESLGLYLELEKMRFKDSFVYQINTTDVIDKDSIEMPSMLIQPYVENAIKHGLLHREKDRILQVIFEQKETYLLVIVEDNGIGRERSTVLNKIKRGKHQSFSTAANEKRLEILNRRGGGNSALAVKTIDKYDKNGVPTGTRVELVIPFD